MSSQPPPPPASPPPPTGAGYLGHVSVVREKRPIGLAVVSLILAIIGCCAGIVPIITSLIALNRASRGIAGGKLVAQIALVLSTFWLVVTLVSTVLVVKLMTVRDDSGDFTKQGYSFASDVRVGDCMQQPKSSPIFVEFVPCNLPHETEVFAILPRAKGTSQEAAELACAPAFKDYVGKKVEKSELQLTAVNIAQSRLTTTGRTACLVGQKGGLDTAGTLRHTKR